MRLKVVFLSLTQAPNLPQKNHGRCRL